MDSLYFLLDCKKITNIYHILHLQKKYSAVPCKYTVALQCLVYLDLETDLCYNMSKPTAGFLCCEHLHMYSIMYKLSYSCCDRGTLVTYSSTLSLIWVMLRSFSETNTTDRGSCFLKHKSRYRSGWLCKDEESKCCLVLLWKFWTHGHHPLNARPASNFRAPGSEAAEMPEFPYVCH